jgi:hypothetical protein
MISSMETWGEEHERFNLVDFFNLILKLFSDRKDTWVVKTLAWWNKCVNSV